MTRMTRPDCAVMCNLINTHTHTHNLCIRKKKVIKKLFSDNDHKSMGQNKTFSDHFLSEEALSEE